MIRSYDHNRHNIHGGLKLKPEYRHLRNIATWLIWGYLDLLLSLYHQMIRTITKSIVYDY